MQSLTLNLITANGDALMELSLPQLQIAGAGELAEPRQSGEMSRLVSLVRSVISEHGLTVVLDDIDLQIAFSRVLLRNESDTLPAIQVLVADDPRNRADEADLLGSDPEPDRANTLFDLEGLFDLDGLNLGGADV